MVNFFEKFPRLFTAAHKHADNTNYKISRKKKIKSLLIKLLVILYIQEYMKNGIYIINIYVNIKIRNRVKMTRFLLWITQIHKED